MDSRYEQYNEITFEAYCKTSIRNAIRKGRRDKQVRARREVPIDEVTDKILYALCFNQPPAEVKDRDAMTFYIDGKKVLVEDWKLGQALARLTPQRRNILLMSYFWEMSDTEIAEAFNVGKSTVQWWRTVSTKRLRDFLGDTR